MSSDSTLWYRVGYALEQARQLPASGKRTLAGLRERATSGATEDPTAPDNPGRAGNNPDSGRGAGKSALPVDEVVTTGALALGAKVLDRWGPGPRTGLGTVLRAGAAGAAAALLVELVRPLLRTDASTPELDARTPEHLLAGAGQGLVYGAVLEPWIPGPTLLKGTVFGSAEYLLHPSGGFTRLLGGRSPLGRVPFVLKLLEGLESRDRKYLEHLTFGIALAVLYGSSPSSNGMRDDGE